MFTVFQKGPNISPTPQKWHLFCHLIIIIFIILLFIILLFIHSSSQ